MSNGTIERSRVMTPSVRYVRQNGEARYPFTPYGLIPLIGLLMLLTFGLIPFARDWVERKAEQTAQQALSEIGADWATPNASGQWVRLEGTPPSRAGATEAIEAVRKARTSVMFGSARPATRVSVPYTWPEASANIPTVTPPPAANLTNPNWSFQLSDGVLRLTGEVPDEVTHLALLDVAQAAIEPPRLSRIEDAVTVTGVTAQDGFKDVALRGVHTVTRCDDGIATFTDSVFSLRCELPQTHAASTQNLASAALPIGRLGTIEILTNEAVASCEQSLADLLSTTRIEFETASSRLTTRSDALLDAIARSAVPCPGNLRIEGHTDNVGRASYNEGLSLRRAQAVRGALIQRGLPGDRLVAEGFGPRRPVAVNNTETGRARNRRIEIRVVRASD